MQIPAETVRDNVTLALGEDVGAEDVTAALIDPDKKARSKLLCREAAVICGQPWFDETLRQVDPGLQARWLISEGSRADPGSIVALIEGPARPLLTAERTAMNFLQLLSGVATRTAEFVAAVAGTGARILDTRKTVPGLRLAQKYAVACGGGVNHRIGLFDAYLIKENHIAAAGSISAAISRARAAHPELPVEVEIENLDQLQSALDAGPDRIMLDNFSLEATREAVRRNAGKVELEASGGVDLDTVRAIAETGVDFISTGSITKHVRATDFSLRFD